MKIVRTVSVSEPVEIRDRPALDQYCEAHLDLTKLEWLESQEEGKVNLLYRGILSEEQMLGLIGYIFPVGRMTLQTVHELEDGRVSIHWQGIGITMNRHHFEMTSEAMIRSYRKTLSIEDVGT